MNSLFQKTTIEKKEDTTLHDSRQAESQANGKSLAPIKEMSKNPPFTLTIYELLGSSATLFLFGMYFGNMILICMGLVPLFFTFVGLAFPQPSGIVIKRVSGKNKAVVGEVIENVVEFEVKEGIGAVVIADDLPQEFELVSGSNFKVVWKWLTPKRDRITYSMKCTKRGIYELKGVRWESRHPLGLRQAKSSVCAERKIVVKPRLFDVRKARSAIVASKIPFPSSAVTKFGPITMDFKELKHYSHGDPFKFINWKATARAFRGGYLRPIINEYEREGMKIVWIMLDCSSTMTVGPSTTNVFEHAVGVVNGLAYYYLRRGCRVGLCIYHHENKVLYPDVGNRQYYRILQEILRITPSELSLEKPDLKKAVSACKGYIAGAKPLFVIVTRFNQENATVLIEGIKEIAKLTKTTGQRLPILVVNVSGYHLSTRGDDEIIAGDMLWAGCILSSRRFRGRLCWVDWDPTRKSFTSALLTQVVKS